MMAQLNSSMFNQLIGMNLKYMRKQKNLTQEKVSKVLNVTFQQIQKYERGVNALCAFKIKQYCDFFKVSFKDISDPYYIERQEALKEVKSLNNGDVKYKDFMNIYCEMIDGKNNS